MKRNVESRMIEEKKNEISLINRVLLKQIPHPTENLPLRNYTPVTAKFTLVSSGFPSNARKIYPSEGCRLYSKKSGARLAGWRWCRGWSKTRAENQRGWRRIQALPPWLSSLLSFFLSSSLCLPSSLSLFFLSSLFSPFPLFPSFFSHDWPRHPTRKSQGWRYFERKPSSARVWPRWQVKK